MAQCRSLRWNVPTGSAGHGDRVFFGNFDVPGGAVGTSIEVPPRLVAALLRQLLLSLRSHISYCIVSINLKCTPRDAASRFPLSFAL